VATAEEETGSSEIITQSSTEEGAPAFSSNFPGSSNDDDEDPEGNSDLSSNPESIASWISVFTAIVGALAAAFSFATKYLGFKILSLLLDSIKAATGILRGRFSVRADTVPRVVIASREAYSPLGRGN